MNKKLRYLILLICFLVFLGLAPFLVFYVRGVKYDVNAPNNKTTGIIAIESEPSGAIVWLNGTSTESTPASLRFLAAGDYDVRVHKDGYFDWQKKLPVFDSKVTWANPNPNKLVLIKSDPQTKNLASGATLFAELSNGTIAYATESSVVLISGSDYATTESLAVKKPITNIFPNPTSGNALLTDATKTYLLDADAKSITDVSRLVKLDSRSVFSSRDELFTLVKDTLSLVNFKTSSSQVIASNVINFDIYDGTLYVMQAKGKVASFATANLGDPKALQPILEGLPALANSRLIVTQQKQIFLLGNNSLYRVNNTLEELVSNINGLDFDRESNSLTFTKPGELYYYNFDENKVKLISRSQEAFISTQLRRDMNYAFYIHTGSLIAIELDDRDRQNAYTIQALKNPKNFSFIDDKRLILLDGGQIQLLTVK